MNKQIFFALAAIILGSISANAQNKGDVELGIGFGVQMSADFDNNSKSSKYLDLKSLGAGISAEYYLSEDWGIKMKVLYDSKGWSSTYTPSVIGLNLEEIMAIPHKRAYNQLNYLTIPIMANWHFGTNKNWYLNFGPYFGFLLDNKGSSPYWKSKKSLFVEDDFGLAYGIGYKFEVKENIKLFFEVDGQHGFTDIDKRGYENVKNARIGLNFGVLFSL